MCTCFTLTILFTVVFTSTTSYDRGNQFRKLNRFEEALQSYDRTIEIQPDHAQAFNNRGRVLEELNRFEEALQSYDRTIEIQPNHAQAFNNRGIVLKKLNRFEEALQS